MHDGTSREIYPALPDEERRIAEENLDRYLEIAWEIMEELQSVDHAP